MKKITTVCRTCQASHTLEVKNFSGGMARTLITLCRRYEQVNGSLIDAKQAGLSPGDLTKLSLWGFVQQAEAQGRKKKSGLWSPTTNGWNFAKGQTFTVKALLTEDGAPTGGVDTQVGIQHLIKTDELARIWSS